MGLRWSSGSSNGTGDGQQATTASRPVLVPTTSAAGSGTGNNQGESSSSSCEDWDPDAYDFSDIVADEELETDGSVSAEQAELETDGSVSAEQPSNDEGVQLQRDQPRWKHWVDESTRANCIMLFARGLIITWGSDTRYWSWRKLRQEEMISPLCTEDTDVEVAYLKAVCWLEIRGSLDMSHLTPGFTYDVFFVAKLARGAYGWSVPVELQLTAPILNGPCTVKEDMWRMRGKKGWSELKVGEVVVPPTLTLDGKKGNVDVAMLRLDGEWKRGLTLLGIKIIPRSNRMITA